MSRGSALRVLVAYAAISSVYLLYWPHALPVLDDWSYLQLWEEARAGGLPTVLGYLQRLIDNTYNGNLRLHWTSFLPSFALFFAAGLTPWPYFLLAWTAHLATAVLLGRLVSLLAGSEETGFAAGALYAVFPATNYVRFAFLSATFYHLQVLFLVRWFYFTWTKTDLRYRWKDFLMLFPVAFSGEQILPALALLPLLTHLLWGRRQDRRPFARFWLTHLLALSTLIGFYILVINRVPIAASFARRYEAAGPFTVVPLNFFLFGSLGLEPEFTGWRPAWRLEPALLAVLGLAAAGLAWGLYRRRPSRSSDRLGELLLWSTAGVILTWLPLLRLASFEWRYLYVPSLFLVPAGIAVLGLFPRPVRIGVTSLAVLYSISYTYFEMRQCWVPQSQVARAVVDALVAGRPYQSHEVVVFSGGPSRIGPAPAFIHHASWSLRSVLALYGGAPHLEGARDLLVDPASELFLDRGDEYRPLKRQDLTRLRILTLAPDGRFRPNSVLVLPGPERIPLAAPAPTGTIYTAPHRPVMK